MATPHSLTMVLPSLHPKAAPCPSQLSSTATPRSLQNTPASEAEAPAREEARTGDTQVRLRSPSIPALLGQAPGGSISPQGTRRFPGDTALPGRGQLQSSGQTGSGGISVVTGERQAAGAVPVSGESSLAARHGHGFPGTATARHIQRPGTCRGTAAIREEAERGNGAEPPGARTERCGWGSGTARRHG